MKRVIVVALVVLAGILLSPQPQAFFHELGNWGFSEGERGSASVILQENGHFLLLETYRKLLKE